MQRPSPGEGRESQYPAAYMTSGLQRETVKKCLAQPLADQTRVGMAFRIVWRGQQEIAWSQILNHRHACDRFLKSMEGASMFVSSITGMLGKAPGGGKMVNAAVTYWVVLKCPEIDARVIVRSMQGALHGQAEVKLLQEPPIISAVDTIHTTLCNVMKDHSNNFIRRRISQALPEITEKAKTDQGFATRIIVVDQELAYFAKQAQEYLIQGGIAIEVVDY